MAVEAFIKPSDAKITVEKEAKPKPTLAELTTVESPGKPSSALLLEEAQEKKPKKSTRRKIQKGEAEVIKAADATLIITEKPQAAQKIAFAIGKPRKLTEEGVSYYEIGEENKIIYVASAVGHLFGLDYKKGQKGWPIFELEWRPSFEKKNSAFTRRYYALLKKLSARSSEFVVATDFDIEGEVIGWNVLRFICRQKNAKRMKFSTLTAPELKKAFESPMPELAWGNAYAGETRHILDWMYGINLSRALMSAIKKVGSFRLLSIGRVQGPALKIIVDRERLIANFKPVPYWQVFALSNKIEFKHPRDIFEKDNLEVFKTIKEALAETKKSEEKIQSPYPFDLTTLQREAYRLYKINPSETLSIAQRLYLEGIISYPRTSSQKIPEAIEPKKIIKILQKYFPEAKFCTRSKPIEGKKSDPAHPSIYPTGEHKSLAERDEKIYQIIVKRFLAAFSPDAKVANKRIVLTALDKKGDPLKTKISEERESELFDEEGEKEDKINNKIELKEKEYIITFTASAQTILEKGWLNVYPTKIEESSLPDISGKIKIDKIRFEEKETQPPNRYTPASLVSILERKNLGTKATRSMIIETLFDRGYLEGQSIKATPLGMRLIESLEKYSSIIIDENLTRQLEEEIEKMQDSKNKFEQKEKEVIDKAKKIINDISKEFKINEVKIGQELLKGLEILRSEQQQNNTLMPCPACKKGNLRILFNRGSRRYFVACSSYPECRQTYSLPPNALIKKSDKVCEADGFPKLLAIRKAKRPWEFCFNPECPIEKRKKEEWASKKQGKDNEGKIEE